MKEIKDDINRWRDHCVWTVIGVFIFLNHISVAVSVWLHGPAAIWMLEKEVL